MTQAPDIHQGRPSIWKDGPVCYEDEEAELLGLHGSLVSRLALIDLALVVDGEEDRAHRDNHEHHRDRRGEDREEVAALNVHVAHEVLFAHRSKDQRQQDRAERELILVHQPADHAEDHAHTHVEHVLVDGERAQQGDDQNDRA